MNTTKTGEATVTFDTITTAGAVHQTPIDISSFPALPMGTNTGLNYDISTSAVSGKNGVRNAVITLSGGNLPQTISTRTGSFGYYKFDDLEVGQTYVLTVNSKRYVFTNPTRIVSLFEEITDADFIAESP